MASRSPDDDLPTSRTLAIEERLCRIVSRLAQPADVQLSLYRHAGFLAAGDELTLEFDEAVHDYRTSRREISPAQDAAIVALARDLTAIFGPANERFWRTQNPFATDPRWEHARSLAIAVLDAFSWPRPPTLQG